MKRLLLLLPLCLSLSGCFLNQSSILTLKPTKLSIVQGSTATLELSYDLQGGLYFNIVTLSLENPPQGISAEKVLLNKTNTPFPMTISATENATLGVFTLEVIQESYKAFDSATLELTVLPKP